jgi:uncharacterized protein YjbJ (UPF0337 family)
MNKDQVKGRVKQAAGKIKEVAGKVTGNKKTELDGAVQKAAGASRANFGDAKGRLLSKTR